AFAGTQFFVSNFVGVQLTDILSSTAAMAAVLLVVILSPGKRGVQMHKGREIFMAWMPYILLVGFVLLWGHKPFQAKLNTFNIPVSWPGLHNTIVRMPPVVAKAAPYPAVYTFPWLSASGTACLFAAILAAVVAGLKPGQFARVFTKTSKQLALPEL